MGGTYPAAAGTVGKQTHTRVGNRVQRARQQEHGADKAGGDTKNIGVKKHHVQHDVIKNNVAGGITHAITNFLFDGQNVIFHMRTIPLAAPRVGTGYGFCKPLPH